MLISQRMNIMIPFFYSDGIIDIIGINICFTEKKCVVESFMRIAGLQLHNIKFPLFTHISMGGKMV